MSLLPASYDTWKTTAPSGPDEPKWGQSELDAAWESLADVTRREVLQEFMEDDAAIHEMVLGDSDPLKFDAVACAKRFESARNEWLIDSLSDAWNDDIGPLVDFCRANGSLK